MSEADKLFYLIENKILFIPSKQCLVHTDSHEQIKLKPTASLCLLLLLRNHGEIVTQNELLAFAWGDSHRQVSFNAFYQSILSLRKSFVQMNLEKQIITTVPRKGLIIQQEISVEVQHDPVPEMQPEALPIEITREPTPYKTINEKRSFLNLTEWLMIIATVLIMGVVLYPRVYSEQYFSGYVSPKKYDGQCHYFFNGDTSNHLRHEAFIKEHPELCKDDNYLYITAYTETKNISVILCTTSMELSQGNSCQTVYYPRYDSQ